MKVVSAADAIRDALLRGPDADTPSREVSHCCALVTRLYDTLLRHTDSTVQFTGDGGHTVSMSCSDIDRTWITVSRTLAARDPALFICSHTNVVSKPDRISFDVVLPTVGCVNVRARFIAMERSPRFCCRVCRTQYDALLNARSCARSHSTAVTMGACSPEPPVPGRRDLMVAHWERLSIADRRRVAAYALDDITTLDDTILDIHRTVLDAVCGIVDGETLVAALDKGTEGTMLLPGFGTGHATNANPHNVRDCEAIVAWWTAARLASDAMATAVLLESAPLAHKKKKKKKKPKNKKCVPWSSTYSFPEPKAGEFDVMAAIRFLERRVREVVG